ncbi:hypothetical protein BKA70DRAFT_1449505 [Coprinopsis sp. MPI-PUGE-AT-0042]|nr:hypothetical protein BKA70DRAFT_1449505 [Coprinopsis sp. MPI-PUGE-AT-0042]
MSSTPHMNTNKTLPPLPGVLKEISLRGCQAAFPRSRTIDVLFVNQGPNTFRTFHTFVAVDRYACLAKFALQPEAIDLPFLSLHFRLPSFVLIRKATLSPRQPAQLVPP